MRFLIRHDKLTPEFVDSLCELVLRGPDPQKKRSAKKI
jgi:hypothetical protein